MVERLVHQARGETGIAQDEIRRRNFIRTLPLPDAGRADLRHRRLRAPASTRRMKMADAKGFAARKAEAAKRGKLRGIGFASYIEACGLAPSNVAGALGARAGLFEAGEVRVHPTGRSRCSPARTATARATRPRSRRWSPTRLGIPVENVDVVHGDTGRVPFGMGTYGSRSLVGRRHGDREGAGQDHRQGQEDRRAPAGGGRGATSSSRTASSRWRAPTAASTVRRGRAHRLRAAQLPARQARAGPRTRPRSTTRPTSPSRPARTSARSRSIPTPASTQVVQLHRRATTSATSSTR